MLTQPITESTVNNEEDVRDDDSSSSTGSSAVGQEPAVKLPKLEIIKFRGDYTKWQVHVARDALNTIEGLSLTNDNYTKALEL